MEHKKIFTVKKLMSGMVYIGYLLYYCAAYLLGLLLRYLPYYRDMWLIAERKTEARDNGYHFFRYLCQNHPEVNAAFLIDKHSPDYAKIASLGKTVQPGTVRHMLAFACAKIRISTHYMSCSPDDYRFAVLNRFRLVRGKNAVIRHGITSNDLKELHFPKARMDLLVCSAIPEYQNMIENYGHPSGVVQRLGLCRYDRLLAPHTVKKQILLMPTWRYALRNLSDAAFVKTEYYRQFSALLNDETLHRFLDKYDYTFVFYLHYVLQPYSHLFHSDHPRIQILQKENHDVQQLLMESAFLITDYSSVFFDFAYVGKPLAYLQFDEETFFKTQYGRGYFHCRRDGFGPVFDSAGNAAAYVCQKIKDGMTVEKPYQQRADQFFDRRCADHCEKTYRAIRALVEKA